MTSESKIKTKNSNIKKYGVDSFSKTDEYKQIIKETCLEKYKVDNVSKIKEIKQKKCETFIENYGVDCYFKTKEFKKSIKSLFIEKYGVDNPFKSTLIKKLIKEKNILNGRWLCNENYENYRRQVDYYTKKNKKELLENWNGYDYYDNEFIFDNFLLDNNSNKYPSIDHKIPVSEGFKRNLTILNISDISNLCITKRSINSSKGNKLNFNYDK